MGPALQPYDCVPHTRNLGAAIPPTQARLEIDFQTSRFGEVEWAHTLERNDTQARLAAAALVMHLTREAAQ